MFHLVFPASMPGWSAITDKPTTLAGYGITDATPLSNPVLPGTLTVGDAAYLGGGAGNEGLRVNRISGTVDRVEIQGAVSGSAPMVRATGQSTHVSLGFWAKGGGGVIFYAGNAAQLIVQSVNAANNFVQVAGANGGNPSVYTNGGALLLNGAAGTIIGGSTAAIGFYGRFPVARQALSGVTADPVLRSLCTILDNLGLVQSSVTAP